MKTRRRQRQDHGSRRAARQAKAKAKASTAARGSRRTSAQERRRDASARGLVVLRVPLGHWAVRKCHCTGRLDARPAAVVSRPSRNEPLTHAIILISIVAAYARPNRDTACSIHAMAGRDAHLQLDAHLEERVDHRALVLGVLRLLQLCTTYTHDPRQCAWRAAPSLALHPLMYVRVQMCVVHTR
jgi:hypothetical protein